MQIITNSAQETKILAARIAKNVPWGTVIRLEGRLGSGKTTFTQGFAKALGVTRAVKSPTYTIVKEYPLSQGYKLVHIDAYRLENLGGDSIDLASFLTADALVLVEWAEFIEDDLPKDYLIIRIDVMDQSRRAIDIDIPLLDSKYSELIIQMRKELVMEDFDEE